MFLTSAPYCSYSTGHRFKTDQRHFLSGNMILTVVLSQPDLSHMLHLTLKTIGSDKAEADASSIVVEHGLFVGSKRASSGDLIETWTSEYT